MTRVLPWTSGTQPGSEYGLASSLLFSYNLCLDFMVILDTKQAPVPTTRILRYKKTISEYFPSLTSDAMLSIPAKRRSHVLATWVS